MDFGLQGGLFFFKFKSSDFARALRVSLCCSHMWRERPLNDCQWADSKCSIPENRDPTVESKGIRIPCRSSSHAVKHPNSIKARLPCRIAKLPLGIPASPMMLHRRIAAKAAPANNRGANRWKCASRRRILAKVPRLLSNHRFLWLISNRCNPCPRRTFCRC